MSEAEKDRARMLVARLNDGTASPDDQAAAACFVQAFLLGVERAEMEAAGQGRLFP